MLSEEVVSKLRRLMEAREKRDTEKKAAEISEAEYREVEAEVYEAFEENPISGSLKVDLGEPWGTVSFSPQETYYGRIIDPDAALEYYEGRAMSDEVIQPKFAKRRINEDVRERIDNQQSMPPGVDYYANRFVRITRQKD